MKNTVNVVQQLDTPIEVARSQAFAAVSFRFTDQHNREATVTLDMESAITVLAFMDNGPEAIGEIQAAKRPWWWMRPR
jgi:hypothetical protein